MVQHTMMKFPVIILVTQIFWSAVIAELCEDVDSMACARIANAHPDMCNDSCIANVCKRHCGHCPLKCYSCSDISLADTCNTTQVCSTSDHSCTVVKSYTNDFKLVYKLGCAQNSICQAQEDFNCCTTDLCNHHAMNTRSDDAPSQAIKRASSGVCADIDDIACNLLHKANPNMCSEDCIATSLCPRLCGKCYECYECDHVSRTENCNATRICELGHIPKYKSIGCPGHRYKSGKNGQTRTSGNQEVCYTIETLNFNLEHGFKVGCVHNQVCNSLTTEASNIFGRRDSSVELSLNGGCCHGDLCNLHQLLPTATTKTTMAPTTTKMAPTTTTSMPTTATTSMCHYHYHCPIGYYAVNGKCYHYVTREMIWSEARINCKQTCGRLAEFSNQRELRDFTHHDTLTSIFGAAFRHKDFFVGGYDPTHTNHWQWASTGQIIPQDIMDAGDKVGHYCGSLRSGHSEVDRKPCTSTLYSLCQADYHY